MLNKFVAQLKLTFKQMAAYKFDVGIFVIISPITLAIYYFLWKSIYAYTGQTIIRGYTFNELIIYFILIQIAWSFVWSQVDTRLSSQIRSGSLAVTLTKPFTIFKSLIVGNIGEILAVLAIQGIPLIVIGAVFFGLRVISWSALTFSIISFTLAVILAQVFAFFCGLSSFWVTEYEGIRRIRGGITQFLGGSIMPLAFFPEIWQKIFNFLPFQYMYYIPIQVYLGKYSALASLGIIGVQLFWIILFFVLIKLVWPKAMARFSAVGG